MTHYGGRGEGPDHPPTKKPPPPNTEGRLAVGGPKGLLFSLTVKGEKKTWERGRTKTVR